MRNCPISPLRSHKVPPVPLLSSPDLTSPPPPPEMAKRVANILRVVLSLQQAEEGGANPLLQPPHAKLTALITRLPMPEDYALEELRGLTQSYLRHLIDVQ